MKHVLVSVLCVLSLIVFAQCGVFTHPSTKKVANTIPDKVLCKIQYADSIWGYRVDGINAADDSAEILLGFPIIGNPIKLTAQYADSLKFLVKKVCSYKSDNSVNKFSTFIPDYGFMFRQSNDSTILLVDLHADIWTIHDKKGNLYQVNSDSVKFKLNELLPQVFPMYDFGKNSTSSVVNSIDDSEVMDSMVYVKLDEEICNILQQSSTVSCYIIDASSEADEYLDKFGSYILLQQKEVKDSIIVSDIRRLLVGEKSFEKLEVVKNCTFLPDIVFRFHKDGIILDVYFSFYCNECEMRISDKIVFRNDCSLIQPQVIKIAQKIFPRDKYLRIF